MPTQDTTRRNRLIYAGAAIGVIALGLASRKFPAMFPEVLERQPGDGLWALMVFLGYCMLLPNAKTWQVAALALVSSYAVEFGQLYQAPWILSIRGTTLGRLALGSTFFWVDLVTYAIGIGIGAICDRTWLLSRARRESDFNRRQRL